MRNGVRWTRRSAAVAGLLLVTLLVTGPGANASGITSYFAQASATTLSVNVSLPLSDALGSVLNNVGIKGNTISERISFSDATANVNKDAATGAVKTDGTALGQVFFGSLDATLLQVARLVGYTQEKLPEAAARVGGTQSAKNALLSLNIPEQAPLIHLGVAEATATAQRAGNLVQSSSRSTLASLKVDLSSVLSNSQLQSLLAPVQNLLDGNVNNPNDGLIGQLNGGLKTLSDTLNSTGAVHVDLSVPQIHDLLNKPLLSVGLIESISDTGFHGAARTAHAVTRLANVDVLGGFIHLDAINIEALAQIDGTVGGASATNAIQRIVGLRVGNNIVNLNTGSIQVLGKTVEMPADLTALFKTTIDALGFKVAIAQAPQVTRGATHSRAAASSLHLELAPKIGGTTLFAIALNGPAGVADVQGGNVLGSKEIRIPTTGIGDDALWLTGFTVMGLAIAVRRFAISH